MKTLNTVEIEEVAGGFPIGALPMSAFLVRPMPQPSEQPVTREGAE